MTGTPARRDPGRHSAHKQGKRSKNMTNSEKPKGLRGALYALIIISLIGGAWRLILGPSPNCKAIGAHGECTAWEGEE